MSTNEPFVMESESTPFLQETMDFHKNYTGVLFVHQNFGRHKTKLLYRCVPTDKHLPTCLIPYNTPIGFLKKPVHKYVLFRYQNSSAGQLISVLGDMDDLHAYYDYLLHAKQLFYNKAWTKGSCSLPCVTSSTPLYDIPWTDKENVEEVFTIDSEDTVDYDDALQYHSLEEGRIFRVSVYITCVAALFSTEDWIYARHSFMSNSSTLYLPHRRIPMLLDHLSQQVTLSTKASKPRICLVARFSYDASTMTLLDTVLELTRVKVCHNWSWSEGDLHAQPLHEFTQRLIGREDSSEEKSRETVAYWMVQYNQFITQFCYSRGLYAWYRRSPGKIGRVATAELLHGENLYLPATCTEMKFQFDRVDRATDRLVPATNPMRRILDLWNQYCLLFHHSLPRNILLMDWFRQSTSSLNTELKAIAKIQRNCRLLDRFQNSGFNSRHYAGILFHPKVEYNSSKIKNYLYSVFFRELGVYLSIKSAVPLQEGIQSFQLFYFKDALQMHQKICVCLA